MNSNYLAPYFTENIGWTVCENQFSNGKLTGFVNHRFSTEKDALVFWAEKEVERLRNLGWDKKEFAEELKKELAK